MQTIPINFANDFERWCTDIAFNNHQQIVGIVVILAFMFLIISSFCETISDPADKPIERKIVKKSGPYIISVSVLLLTFGISFIMSDKAPDKETIYNNYNALNQSNLKVKFKRNHHKGHIVMQTSNKKLVKIKWTKVNQVKLIPENAQGKMTLNMMQYLQKQKHIDFIKMTVYQHQVLASYHDEKSPHYLKIDDKNPDQVQEKKVW